jgi:hypothetical protein
VLDELNPYEPPRSSAEEWRGTDDSNLRSRHRLYGAWFGVCALNMPVPLLFGLQMTRAGGRIGMLIAMLALLGVGFWICVAARKIAVCTIIGAILVGLSQVVPIAQMFAGLFALGFGHALGLAVGSHGDVSDHVVGELGGFVVTLLTGTILIVLSAGCGFVLQRILPARWWRGREQSGAV